MRCKIGAETFAVLSAAGGLAKAYGSYTSGKQKQQMYDYNAGINTQKASLVRQASALNDYEAGLVQEQLIGAQRAGFAGSGVKVDTGSPLDVMVHTLSESNLDRAVQKYSYETAARGLEDEARLNRLYGKDAKKQGIISAFSSLLETAATFGASQK